MSQGLCIRVPTGYPVELPCAPPREVWEGNIEVALNHYTALPTEGSAALEDRAEGIPVFGRG